VSVNTLGKKEKAGNTSGTDEQTSKESFAGKLRRGEDRSPWAATSHNKKGRGKILMEKE